MKLLIRRNQRTNLTGTPIFVVEVRAEISKEEQAYISKYKLGSTMLFKQFEMANRGTGIPGFLWRLFFHATNLTISVKDLVNGKRIECKDVVEMLAAEKYITEAAQTFGQVLRAATHFDGEEVIPF